MKTRHEMELILIKTYKELSPYIPGAEEWFK